MTSELVKVPQRKEFIMRFDNLVELKIAFKLLKTEANINKIVVFENEDIEKSFESFKNLFNIEKAAGGMVENEAGELLLIYRNKHWDLPKGHIEPGESEETAAVREVQEECGINNISIDKKIDYTYHIFKRKKEYILKQTVWFEMKVQGKPALTPQTEEGVEKAEWKTKAAVFDLSKKTFPSIVELIKGSDWAKY